VAYLSLRNKVKKRLGELERAKFLEKYAPVVANIQGELKMMERIKDLSNTDRQDGIPSLICKYDTF
jgi:hypothetical protein